MVKSPASGKVGDGASRGDHTGTAPGTEESNRCPVSTGEKRIQLYLGQINPTLFNQRPTSFRALHICRNYGPNLSFTQVTNPLKNLYRSIEKHVLAVMASNKTYILLGQQFPKNLALGPEKKTGPT